MAIDTETEYASKEEQEAAEAFNEEQSIREEAPTQPSSSIINDINSIDPKNPEPSLEEKEFQLTPEIKEKIMEKLKDINESGTAFTSLSFAPYKDQNAIHERFGNVIEMGLLGTNGAGGDDFTREEFLNDWYENVRTKPVFYSEVYFNIVGRIDRVQGDNQIAQTRIIAPDGVGLLMDISGLQELPQGKYKGHEKGKFKITRTFSADRVNQGVGYYTQTIGDWFRKPESGSRFGFKVPAFTGFVTPYRVAPRFLEGVVVNSADKEIINNYRDIMVGLDKDKPDRLMPIYNVNGDLLWPERMDYEDVKRISAENESLKKVREQIKEV